MNITSVWKMEDEELAAYMMAERELVRTFTADHRFTLNDIDLIHKKFLGRIYSWAGRYRDVNLSKGGFVFASARAIPHAMMDFEQRILRLHSPCREGRVDEIAGHLAVVHAEFLLIHPYREGNGRTARLLATLMSYQAGMPGLDFGFIGSRGKEFDQYIAAIQAGLT
ncbi:MAG: Fic family protein, partial [Bacteroidota bacterium]